MNITKRCIWPLLMHGRRVALAITRYAKFKRLCSGEAGGWNRSCLCRHLSACEHAQAGGRQVALSF
ncbi:MAG: hypothetical protein KAU60_08740, partial [Desulfobacterales bacterium]|nr:hypothetical protein [Desulfobacterales bacterium]